MAMKFDQGSPYPLRAGIPWGLAFHQTWSAPNRTLLRRRVPLVIFVVGLSAILSGCVNKAQQNFERPPSPVQVTVAISQDVPTYLDAIGKTVAREVVSIQPQVSGRITKIHFTDGANVKKGQLLFTIDTRPFEANLKQAQANLSQRRCAEETG